MDLAEIPFKGRLVTYPAVQYGNTEDIKLLNEVCHNVKSSGFKFVVIMTADVELSIEDVPESTLVLSRRRLEASEGIPLSAIVTGQISEMWRGKLSLNVTKPTIYERAIGSEPKFGVQILDGLGSLRYY